MKIMEVLFSRTKLYRNVMKERHELQEMVENQEVSIKQYRRVINILAKRLPEDEKDIREIIVSIIED